MGRKKTSKKTKPKAVESGPEQPSKSPQKISTKNIERDSMPGKKTSKKKASATKKTAKTASRSPKKSTKGLEKPNHALTPHELEKTEGSLDPALEMGGPLDENLSKLLTEEERVKMEENLDIVECYLGDIGIVDMKVDREKLIIAIPFDYEEFTFLSHIVLSPEWILIKTSILEIDQLTQSSLINLFAEILKGNFILNSVVYSLDPENKSIWAQADVPISADFETFKLNYFSIVFAIDYFMKNISPKLQMQLRSTAERENFKNADTDLYI